MFTDKIKRFKAWIEQLSEESSAYLLSVILFLISSIYNFFSAIEGGTVLFVIPLLVLLYGFYVYIIQVFTPVWGSILGKALVSVLAFIGSSFGLALSKLVVNASIQVPSSPFMNTISVTAVLVAPLAVTILFGFFGVLILPISMPLFMKDDAEYSVKKIIAFWNWRPTGNSQVWKFFIRICILISLISMAWTFNGNNSWYTTKVEKFVRWYAFAFDTEIFSHCEMDSGQRVAYIDSTNIIIATVNEKGYQFQVKKCITTQ